MSHLIAEIAVPVPMRRSFDYIVEQSVVEGARVWVTFGRRKVVGIVLATKSHSDVDEARLKPIDAVIDTHSVFDTDLFTLLRWASQYYQHPIGEVLHSALPVRLRDGESAEAPPLEYLRHCVDLTDFDWQKLKRAPRQKVLLEWLVTGQRPASEVRQSFSQSCIDGLLKHQFIEQFEAYPESQQHWWQGLSVADKPTPNLEQSLAITALVAMHNQFGVALLEGITGSGKTEVYLQSIEPLLTAGQQVLILVPEIGLTPQTVARFANRFNVPVEMLHSGMTDKERLSVWRRSNEGEVGIVIGTRSAIFTPFKRLGMIVVDEEHDNSFKQQEGFRYHARDLAAIRARQLNIPVLLGSATPSLETLHNAISGKYRHLVLQARAGNANVASQHLLDIRDQPILFGIASGMVERMRAHLTQGNQVMVFLNRRGYAPSLQCHHCGAVESCQRCDRPYTLHRFSNRLHCHHCGDQQFVPHSCGSCHAHNMITQGVGTEQLEQGLGELFPEYTVMRIDSDNMRSKVRLHQTLEDINSGKCQILVGTQILAKGHHFPRVTLVVIVDVDGALFSADFRAAENLSQLITQVAGRAGRAEHPGEMWLQTHQPGHPLLQDLLLNGYGHFARLTLDERQAAGLPPFSCQALLRCEAHVQEQAYEFLRQARDCFASSQVELLGPIPAPLEKRQGRFRMQLLVQSPQRAVLQKQLFTALPSIESLSLANRVRWSVDVDPQDFS